MNGTRAIALIALMSLGAASLEAQSGVRPRLPRGQRRIQQDAQPAVPGQQGARPLARRQQLEKQIRQGFWRVAKQRIGFSDEQMTQLEQTTQRYDVRRKEIAQSERAERVALRSEILADSAANQARISTALDRLQVLQRQRLEMQADEQKELASFMTPLQRARFLALQEQVRKRVQELVRARPDSSAAAVSPD